MGFVSYRANYCQHMTDQEITKARILQERERREFDRIDKHCEAIIQQARQLRFAAMERWEKLWFAYLCEAEDGGYCRYCAADMRLKRRAECTEIHIGLASPSAGSGT
jgi:hypothetical protein